MKFSLSAIALVATLLAQQTLAGVVAHHPRHSQRHAAAARRSPSEAVPAGEIVARAVATVVKTVVVTVHGTAPTATPQVDQQNKAAADSAAAHFQATQKARISLLQAKASSALEEYSRTKNQKQTTLKTVAVVAPASTAAPKTTATPAPASASAAPKAATSSAVKAQVAAASAPAPAASKAATSPAVKAQVATSAASAPAASETSSTPSGGKRGLAYNDASLVQQLLTGTASGKASWAYNWGSTPGSLPSSVEYVPMLWGPAALHSADWTAKANSAIASGSTHLLGFNEPDHQEQAAIDTGACAAGYKQFMQPFAGKAKLGAPAVTNGGGAMGLTYLKGFMDACSGCTIDFVPIHWYDSASNFEYFKKHIQDAKAVAGDRPLWLTEFGASGSDAEQAAFLSQAIPWLDSQAYVERYAYFWVDQILSKNPTISAAYFGA